MATKKTLVLGASPNAERYSFRAATELTYHKHPVALLGRRAGKIGDHDIDTVAQQYSGIDTVTMYLGPDNQIEYYQYIISLQPKRVIFNPGAENEGFCKMLEKNGVECLNACTLVMLSIGNY